MPSQFFPNIPSVNELLESPQIRKLLEKVNRNAVTTSVRSFLDNLRTEVQHAAAEMKNPTPSELADRIAKWITNDEDPSLLPAINATGTLLHAGLGQVPFASEAIEAIAEVSRGYSCLDTNPAVGDRSRRVGVVEKLLVAMTGAEMAIVVNNHAAATLLALTALAHGKEVVVARGELVEWGDGFRLSDMITASGARLREVGTANKTRCDDYETAICEQTGAFVSAHPSNYVVSGGTEQPTLEGLVALGRKRGLPVVHDIGVGALIDYAKYGLKHERTATESVKAGADIVLLSGNKLLGGPECGIILGRKEWMQRLAAHPLLRALQVDKLTLAALAVTLRLYQDEATAEQSIPLLSFLSTPRENLKNRAERLGPQLLATKVVKTADVSQCASFLGNEAVPTQELVSWGIALSPTTGTAEELAAQLRRGKPAVIGQMQGDRLWLNLRSVFFREDMRIVEAFEAQGKKAETKPEPKAEQPDSPAL